MKQFCEELTEEQRQNWRDYRESEKIIPDCSNLKIWDGVDILRLRRKGEDYKAIVMITGLSFHAVRHFCQLAGLGRKWKEAKL
jgi:hypothetical protein